MDAAAIRRSLTTWFRTNARDLPWRRTHDAYAILVSELMLQQTQVATVIPYYERWLMRFPDFATLAAADEHDALSLWQGLGYYSRARNLLRAARHVVEQHDGEMPRDPALIRALPGVGPYTAGAVASFAFDLPEPLVDGNVARVLARLTNLHTPVDTTAGQRALWDTARMLVPKRGARVFNSALMELGALLCTARSPQCLICPVRTHCAGLRAGSPDALPRKKSRKKLIALAEPCAWIIRDRRILLEHQSGARWRGMWKLPLLPSPPGGDPALTLDYPFTNHRITLSVFPQPVPAQLREHLVWHSIDALAPLPITAPHRRAITALLDVANSHTLRE